MSTETRAVYILLGVFLLCVAILALLPHTAAPEDPIVPTASHERGRELCATVRARAQAAVRDGDGPGFLDREILRSCRESGE